MQDILLWMERSTLGQIMRDVSWAFPAAEILHFLGLCLLMGSLLVVDFRLLGFSGHVSVEAVHRFVPVTVVGFSINLITGILFFFSDPFRYYPNIAFRLKMLIILFAGINALYFVLIFHTTSSRVQQIESTNNVKIVTSLSLVFWVTVIILGRLIPYVK